MITWVVAITLVATAVVADDGAGMTGEELALGESV
jgi:hypothetical protein